MHLTQCPSESVMGALEHVFVGEYFSLKNKGAKALALGERGWSFKTLFQFPALPHQASHLDFLHIGTLLQCLSSTHLTSHDWP